MSVTNGVSLDATLINANPLQQMVKELNAAPTDEKPLGLHVTIDAGQSISRVIGSMNLEAPLA